MFVIVVEGGYIGISNNTKDISKLLHQIVVSNNKILDISIYVLSENNKIIIEKMFKDKNYDFSMLFTDDYFDDLERTKICNILDNSYTTI
jgi:hypothetical protein